MSSLFNDKSADRFDASVGGDTTLDNTKREGNAIAARTMTQRMNKSYERMDKLLSTKMDLHGGK